MITRKRIASGLLAGLAAIALGAPVSAAPLADRLERPARPSANAEHAPLTDLQRLGGNLVMVGASGHILLRDAGGRVRQAEVPVDLLLTAVHFVDERYGWAVGHDGVVLHSSDGGATWRSQLDGRTISQLMQRWAEAEVARLEASSSAAPDDEALLAALDNASFALDDVLAGSTSGPSRPLLDVWFRDASEGWAVGAYGMIVHTRDGGATWEFLPGLDNPDRLHLNAVLGLADGTLLVAGEGGRLYRQAAGQWQPVQPLTQASLYALLPLRDGRVLAMGFGGALFASADQGASWQAVSLPVKASLYGGEQLADGSLLLTASAGQLLHGPDLQLFKAWQGAGKAAWLGAASLADGQLALVGSGGLRVLPLAEIKESRQ
jgi:photosystem II stability/assembly factor-like uncharacterized protein